MKVESIVIRNFKRFDHLEVSFKNHTLDEISDRFLVLGDNGMGKTTLLQAIALPLALATRQIRSVAEFDWIGFLPGRYARYGRPHIELIVTFAEAEIQKTQELAERWHDAQSQDFKLGHPFVQPGDSQRVKLTLDGERCQTEGSEEYYQFCGRYYAMQLLRTDLSVRGEFAYLPGLFWFDQFRNLGAVRALVGGNGDGELQSYGRVAYDLGVAQLRRYLNGWSLARLERGARRHDYLEELENLYKRVFSGRSFAGAELMPGIDAPTTDDYYFLFNDGHRTYDLVEMSSGEQNVFPILYEFVRQRIAYSVVLVDEVDLNLHPPAAQTLVAQLPQIGPTCQFILTTHSESVSDVIGEDDTYRLLGGALCL
jgi:predicted ATPase